MNFRFSQPTRLIRSAIPFSRHLLVSGLLASAISTQSLAVGVAQQASVGEVSMLIGQAYIIRANDQAVPIKVGDTIHVTDTIETSSGGFVHIRFVDNALITVRPYSSLQIERYDYDAEAPQNSAIKLIQQEGVTRYISGEGAEKAKQNFRLNTPIAAIGVRGTDFVISASGNSLRALVNQGAIVAASYSATCSADSLGPCQDAIDAIEVTGLSRQILEMNAGAAGVTTALLPANPAQTQQAVAAAAASVPAENNEKAGKTDIYTDTVSSRAVNQKLVSGAPRPSEPAVVTREYTPDIAASAASLTDNHQLVWGRWSESNVDSARMTVSYATAIQEDRQLTIGNALHGLFRVGDGPVVLQPGLGVVKFELTQAQARYNAGGGFELMDVLGGNLEIDFQQNNFVTDLQLSHAATGRIEFRDGGRLLDGGIFRPIRGDQSQWVAGAVSLDGKEAGYYFEKTLESATIEGLTLWNSTAK